MRGIVEQTSGFSKWALTLSSLHWLHHELRPDTGSETAKYKCKPSSPVTKYLRTWHGLCNAGSIMLKVPQRSTALAGTTSFNHNSQWNQPSAEFLGWFPCLLSYSDFKLRKMDFVGLQGRRSGFSTFAFSVGLPAVPCWRQWELAWLPGFCASLHTYFICSFVIAVLPFCLFCLTQNKIIMAYSWFDTLKKLEEQEDNVCKSCEPFWRKSLPELYLIPSLGVLPGMKSNFSENNLYTFITTLQWKRGFFLLCPISTHKY